MSISACCFLDHIAVIMYAVAEARRPGRGPQPSCLKLTREKKSEKFKSRKSSRWKAVSNSFSFPNFPLSAFQASSFRSQTSRKQAVPRASSPTNQSWQQRPHLGQPIKNIPNPTTGISIEYCFLVVLVFFFFHSTFPSRNFLNESWGRTEGWHQAQPEMPQGVSEPCTSTAARASSAVWKSPVWNPVLPCQQTINSPCHVIQAGHIQVMRLLLK